MSSATVIVSAGGVIWLNPFATTHFKHSFLLLLLMLLLRAVLSMLVRNASPRGSKCFRCLILSLSGPCELLFVSLDHGCFLPLCCFFGWFWILCGRVRACYWCASYPLVYCVCLLSEWCLWKLYWQCVCWYHFEPYKLNIKHLKHMDPLGLAFLRSMFKTALDRTLSYSTHITKVKAKTAARNNVLRKLVNSKWGTHPSTIKTTALCYSTAEYACPVWERSARTHKVDPVLNDACRAITGCLQPTNVENLYLLAGIAPPAVRRSVTAQREREKQVNDNRHPLHGHNLPRKRLKSRNSFLHTTDELIRSPSTCRLEQWSQHLQSVPHRLPQTPSECLGSGASGTWTEWRCLNRLRTKMGRCKHNLRKWKYTDEDDTTCDCKEADQTMEHLLECPLLRQTCSLDDLMVYNDVAKECVRQWIGLV